MRRIVSQFPTNPDPKGYFEAVYEQVKLNEIPEDVFDAACTRLAGSMLPYKPPIGPEYVQAAAAIKAERSRLKASCEKCGGLGLVPTEIYSQLYGTMVKAYAKCQACRPVGS